MKGGREWEGMQQRTTRRGRRRINIEDRKEGQRRRENRG